MDILQFKLYKEICKITDSCNTGSLKYRKVRKNTLKQIASDAIKIKLDLKSFSLFNIENFYVLLEYWKQTHNSDSTILNKRSVLIWYLGEIGVDIDIPKPKQLGLSKKKHC